MPYARLHIYTSRRLKIPIMVKGDPKFIADVFINRDYDKILRHFKGVSTWIDLGCNSGIISLAIYDSIVNQENCRAVLIDAGKRCLQVVERSIEENSLQDKFQYFCALVGTSGQEMVFNEMKHTMVSSAVMGGRKEKATTMTCMGLSEILAKAGMPQGADLLKIDIEGSEKFLIPAQADALNLFEYVWLECHKPHLMTETALNFAKSKNYEILLYEDYEATGMLLWRNPSRAGRS